MPRPYVLLNVAATADGKIDTRVRRGAAISSARDRQRVDELRASVDGVMVGSRTLHDEDPRLTVKSPALRAERVARGQPENPAKVGVASHLELRSDSRFLTSGPARIVLFVPQGCGDDAALRQCGAEIYELGDARVDLTAALSTLANAGIDRLMVEGGGTLNFELLRLGLVDEVQLFIAPLIFGGADAPTLADGVGDLSLQLVRTSVETWDDGGVVLRYRVNQS
jgi:2,5-diamino-6-(ribosylamino)-4(3H)-pyrimidinone 5'-phosphate reductase